eukprot:Nk52_evm31s356 gene=Nk52_evmTU31s356
MLATGPCITSKTLGRDSEARPPSQNSMEAVKNLKVELDKLAAPDCSIPRGQAFASLQKILSALEEQRMTLEILSETRIGKSVNNLRKSTPDKSIASRAKKLVRKWAGAVESGSQPSTPHTGVSGGGVGTGGPTNSGNSRGASVGNNTSTATHSSNGIGGVSVSSGVISTAHGNGTGNLNRKVIRDSSSGKNGNRFVGTGAARKEGRYEQESSGASSGESSRLSSAVPSPGVVPDIPNVEDRARGEKGKQGDQYSVPRMKGPVNGGSEKLLATARNISSMPVSSIGKGNAARASRDSGSGNATNGEQPKNGLIGKGQQSVGKNVGEEASASSSSNYQPSKGVKRKLPPEEEIVYDTSKYMKTRTAYTADRKCLGVDGVVGPGGRFYKWHEEIPTEEPDLMIGRYSMFPF